MNANSTNLLSPSSQDRGSLLPLLIGMFTLTLAVYMVIVDLNHLGEEKLWLESYGEHLVSKTLVDIDYGEYFDIHDGGDPAVNELSGNYLSGDFLDSSDINVVNSALKDWVGIDCNGIIDRLFQIHSIEIATRVSWNSNYIEVDRINLSRTLCIKNILSVDLSKKSTLPFSPPFLSSFSPIIRARVSGGISRVHD